jgi:molybdopterin molybdotransferase
MKFWKIAMKPGKPLAFGVASDGNKQTPLIGLPGNPASSLVCFHQFVKPALSKLQGVEWQPALLEATTTAALSSTPKRMQFITGQLSFIEGSRPAFTPIPDQDSGNPAILANVNAFAIVDQGVASIEANATIQVELI